MKRTVLCLAATCASGVALAQSSVQLFGVADAMVGNYKTEGAGSTWKLNSGGMSASRLGFRGSEDLGSGLAASFWLEAQYAVDTGTTSTTNTNNQPSGSTAGFFNRRSTVSLSGPYGEVRLGRDYVPTFWNFAFYDPFGMFGVASASNLNFAGTTGPAVSAVRNSNSVGYLVNSAAFEGRAGWYGQLQYAFGENASGTAKSSDGQTWSGLIGYASGPWNGSIGYTKTKMLANNDFTLANAGASWDFKVVKAMVEYSVANSGIAGTRYTTYLIGAQIPVGLGYIPVTYQNTRRNDAAGQQGRQLGLGYVYYLSKRTSLYTSYASISNKNGAAFAVGGGLGNPGAPNADSSGVEFGIRHLF